MAMPYRRNFRVPYFHVDGSTHVQTEPSARFEPSPRGANELHTIWHDAPVVGAAPM
jgi:hypothetical protein